MIISAKHCIMYIVHTRTLVMYNVHVLYMTFNVTGLSVKVFVYRIAYINPGSNQILTMHPQSTMQHPQFINMGGHIMEVSVAGTYPG